MRAVMMSIQPKWCELIASGKKTVEVRKTNPKLEVPFKVYIYETKDKRFENIGYCWERGKAFVHATGKVIGEFVCDRISGGSGEYAVYHTEGTCLTSTEIADYIGDKYAYYWHISDLVIYDKPRELGEFRSYNTRTYICEETGLPMPTREITRPPQSWCYVKEGKDEKQHT